MAAAVVLGIGRAVGETMAVLMVTGNAAVITGNLLEPCRTILATIATNDKELAFKIRLREKNINDFELKIDNSCETFMALFSPVAIDLRLVIALLRINGRLERIGDFANGIH